MENKTFFSFVFIFILLLNVSFAAISAGVEYHFHQPTEKHASTLLSIKKEPGLAVLQEAFNKHFNFPQPINIYFEEVKDEDERPYYDPETRKIVIPYHFWTYVIQGFQDGSDEPIPADELNVLAGYVLIHTLYHEIGHALVDTLNLPITGREEDVVDEMATILIIKDFPNHSDIIISSGQFFSIEASQLDEITDDDFFGEHSLEEQRFFNLLCLLYGSGDKESEVVMQELEIQEERLASCEDTFMRRQAAWETILNTYKK